MEFSPEKIHRQYQQNKLDKHSASKLLFSLIENSESDKVRVDCITKLGDLGIEGNKFFKFLEDLLISDSNEKVRNSAAIILRNQYNDKILDLMKWALIHEESSLCLTTIHSALINIIKSLIKNNDSNSKSIILSEVKKIQRNEFKLGFEILCETTLLEEFPEKELADILINFFTLELLEKSYWRLKYEIRDCKIIELDFIFKGLTNLPEAIRYLTSLESLILRYNQLITLPNWIGKLKSLKFLNLNVNNLNSLPKSLESLSFLKGLFLWKNELRSLPSEIGNLSNLELLNLRLNCLEKLPDTIGNLRSLKELNLHDNQLTHLPNSVTQLKKLEELNLSWNFLKTIPVSIGSLTSLKMLDIEKNELIKIPVAICALTCLEMLNLSDNKLKVIPDFFENLKSLKILNLSKNELCSIPKSINLLPSLKELHINDNNLEDYPNWLKNLEDKGIKIYY